VKSKWEATQDEINKLGDERHRLYLERSRQIRDFQLYWSEDGSFSVKMDKIDEQLRVLWDRLRRELVSEREYSVFPSPLVRRSAARDRMGQSEGGGIPQARIGVVESEGW